MAMSKHSQSYVEEMLTCSICLELVNQPRTLQQCFHSFCKPCVEQLVKKQANPDKGVICPVCRSHSNPDEIRVNFLVNDLLQMHKDSLDKHKVRMCQPCSDNLESIAAEWKCLDCKLDMCINCKSSHLKFPMLRGHSIMPLNEETEMVVDKLVFCESHTDKTVELYCLDCDKLICIKCKVTDHESHKCETVEKALERILVEVNIGEQDLDDEIKTIENAVTEANSKIEETKMVHAECITKIQEDEKQKIAHIKATTKKLEDQLKCNEIEQIKNIKIAKETLENQIKERQNLKKVVKISIEKARHASLLKELVTEKLLEKMIKGKAKDKSLSIRFKYPEFVPKQTEEITLGNLQFKAKSFSLGQCDINVNPRVLEWKSLPSILEKKIVIEKEYPIKDFGLRMALVRDSELWVTFPHKNEVGIFNIEHGLNHCRNITVNSPRGIASFKSDVIVACSQYGLYSINTETKQCSKISAGSFCDVFDCGTVFCALEYNKNQILIYDGQCDFSTYNLICTVTLQSTNLQTDHRSTICIKSITNGLSTEILEIYINSFVNNNVSIFDKAGNHLRILDTKRNGKTIGVNIAESYLCTIDHEGFLLIANKANGKFYIFDHSKEENTYTKELRIGSSACVYYDLLINKDATAWATRSHGLFTFTITKFKYK